MIALSLQNASESGGKTNKTTVLSKRKLETTDETLTNKYMRSSNISTDSDIVLIENTVSVITIHDDTITCGKTLIACDNEDAESGAVGVDRPSKRETTTNEETKETSSIYETISETYCSDATELFNVSSKKDSEENESVVFVSETFPSNVRSDCYGHIGINQVGNTESNR